VRRAHDFVSRPFLILAAASVLATGAAAQEDAAADTDPTTGMLYATIDGEKTALPITSMTVELSIAGPLVHAEVRQSFTNPTDETLDAVYVFPLPEGAAVQGLDLTVGHRSFVGKIQEKEEAKKTFETAKALGKGAGLVEQHRPNVFKTSVANIPPHESVVVGLSLLDQAEWKDGAYSMVFPTTITARYEPVGSSSPLPSRTSGVSVVSIGASVDAGVPLAEIFSPSHAIRMKGSLGPTEVLVGDGPVPADRDFVLTWRPKTDRTSVAGGLVERRDDGRYGMAIVVPPSIERTGLPTLPSQTVFVVDVSGSMAGPSIEQAKGALLVALDGLRADDSFTLIKFDSETEAYSERFLPATAGEIQAAKRWVEGLQVGSGTEILPALVRALDLSERGDASVVRRVVLMTDGAVGNEDQVLAAVTQRLGGSRVSIIGIGPAPNRWLMKELARVGRGTFESIGSPEEILSRTTELLSRSARAVITDVHLEWEGTPPIDATPDPVPDLYAGDPLLITARFAPDGPLPRLRVWGRAPGGPVTMDITFRPVEDGSGIAVRWARARVANAEQRLLHGADAGDIRKEVLDLGLRYSLLTRYTSFVVVADEEHELEEPGLDGGNLPQGGTYDPLLLVIGVVLTAGGLVEFIRKGMS
jgi:Ca-activated chloride channel family protein